jgi:hypothetical protein
MTKWRLRLLLGRDNAERRVSDAAMGRSAVQERAVTSSVVSMDKFVAPMGNVSCLMRHRSAQGRMVVAVMARSAAPAPAVMTGRPAGLTTSAVYRTE